MSISQANGVTLFAFAPSLLDVWVDPVPDAADGRVRPHTASHALLRCPDAAAVLDGPMFRVTDSTRPSYRTYRHGVLDYAAYDRSEHLELDGGSATDHRGLTLSVVGDAVHALDGDCRAAGADAAIQLYPTLVRDGAVVASASRNTDRVWRAGVAHLRDGRLAFAVGKMDMRSFAVALRDHGALDAAYTDGGGSARLALRTGEKFGSGEDRPVLAWLIARAS